MKMTDEILYQNEHNLVRIGGQVAPILKTVRRIDIEGRPHYLEAFINISETKQLEEKLQRSRRMEVVGTLAGSVAHDLNNILSGVINYPELMLMNIDEADPMRKPLETIKKSGQKAAAIVQDLLTLARQNVAVKEVINLADVVREYLDSPEYDHLFRRHPKVRVSMIEEETLFTMEGSPIHLGKMIMNLVTNSAEAIPQEGKVEIKLENKYLDVPVPGYDNIKEGEYIVLTVKDNGIGMAPENIDKIFEPFYTNKVLGKSGSGLGMPVVLSTVKEHDGYIMVESVEGQGTTFNIHFPVTQRKMLLENGNGSANIQKGNGQEILVVDDLDVQREIASSLLEYLGYKVQTAMSGEDAIALLKEKQFDLILLDMIMVPGMDGLETYRRIISMYPDQKVTLVSGYADPERVKTMEQLGLDRHIKKPYTLQILAENIQTVLHDNDK